MCCRGTEGLKRGVTESRGRLEDKVFSCSFSVAPLFKTLRICVRFVNGTKGDVSPQFQTYFPCVSIEQASFPPHFPIISKKGLHINSRSWY